jgi:DDE superfamily endonuclease
MEDVLEVSTRPYDPRLPQSCMDESAKQLLQDQRESLPVQPGQPERVDDTFEAVGRCKLFLECRATERTAAGPAWPSVVQANTLAHFIRELVDGHYPTAEQLVWVMDNLNTHTPSSLYQTFAPAEARRILQKLEIHYPPVHGSWLKMAEIELSALARQCLSRRIGTQEELEREVHAWQHSRHEESITVTWRFTTADARIKLKRLYPSLEPRKRSSKQNHVANLSWQSITRASAFLQQNLTCRAQEKLERVSVGIDSSVEVHPGFSDLDVRFIHSPGVIGGFEVRSRALFEFGGVVLHPAVDRGVRNLATTLETNTCSTVCKKILAWLNEIT